MKIQNNWWTKSQKNISFILTYKMYKRFLTMHFSILLLFTFCLFEILWLIPLTNVCKVVHFKNTSTDLHFPWGKGFQPEYFSQYSADIYLFKVNSRSTSTNFTSFLTTKNVLDLCKQFDPIKMFVETYGSFLRYHYAKRFLV